MKGDRERFLEAGMDDYLAKPLRANRLFEVVECAADRVPPNFTGTKEFVDTDRTAAAVRMRTSNPAGLFKEAMNMAAFDPELALDQVGGDPDLLHQLVDAFDSEYPGRLREMQVAIELQQAELLQRAAHTIKGAAMYLGGAALGAIARKIEDAGRAGDFATAAANYSELESAIHELSKAARDYCGGIAATSRKHRSGS
jgi:HPt (histidine-containing phosphotransfer) domain-containing protein